ncbi:MAG: hypothetical protein ACLTBV_31750 [Enterocloster bolteae]
MENREVEKNINRYLQEQKDKLKESGIDITCNSYRTVIKEERAAK